MPGDLLERDPETISGVVTELKFSKPTFCAGRLQSGGRSVSFSVKGFVKANEPVTIRGKWENHPTWGMQFKGDEVVFTMPAGPDGIAAWLAASVPGCGSVKARQLVDLYGADTPRVLKDCAEQVAIEARLPIEFVNRAAELWHAAAGAANCRAALAGHGLTQHEAEKVYARYKGSAVTVLESDPYMLLGDLPGFGWVRVDGIGKKLGVKPDHPGRVRAAVVESVRKEVGEGSTCAPAEGVLNAAHDMLGSVVGRGQVEAGLEDAVKQGYLARLGGEALALPGYKRAEEYLWDRFLTGIDPNPLMRHLPEPALAASDRTTVAYKGETAELDESQVAALVKVACNRFAVITGQAGAGKTVVAKAVLDLVLAEGEVYLDGEKLPAGRGPDQPDDYDDSDWTDDVPRNGAVIDRTPSVALAAPTGKAARRLQEVIGRDASTIHRLLCYQPDTGRFLHNETLPLPYDCVIVDEVSMVDAGLMEDLFRAVGPNTCVVLIGDDQQLPPVGPGYPLRDVLEHGLLPVVRLAKCHRQAGPLKHNSVKILEGVVEPTVLDHGDPGPWVVHRALETAEKVHAAAAKLFTELFPAWGFGGLMDHQFVTAKHEGQYGTGRFNELLQRLAQKRLGVELKERDPDEKLPLLAGDKVIHTKNNYKLNVMNGTIGTVVSESPLCVEYDGRRVAYPSESKSEVSLAYCLSVHKMQGSEVPCIVVVCPKAHAFMQHRNWAYTGVTRARKTAIIIGDQDGIRRAAEKVETTRRRTVLELYARNPEARP